MSKLEMCLIAIKFNCEKTFYTWFIPYEMQHANLHDLVGVHISEMAYSL